MRSILEVIRHRVNRFVKEPYSSYCPYREFNVRSSDWCRKSMKWVDNFWCEQEWDGGSGCPLKPQEEDDDESN